MTSEEYKKLSLKEFNQAAAKLEGACMSAYILQKKS